MIKKKLKKIAGLLLAAAFTTASLGACGKESKKSSAETEGTTAQAGLEAALRLKDQYGAVREAEMKSADSGKLEEEKKEEKKSNKPKYTPRPDVGFGNINDDTATEILGYGKNGEEAAKSGAADAVDDDSTEVLREDTFGSAEAPDEETTDVLRGNTGSLRRDDPKVNEEETAILGSEGGESDDLFDDDLDEDVTDVLAGKSIEVEDISSKVTGSYGEDITSVLTSNDRTDIVNDMGSSIGSTDEMTSEEEDNTDYMDMVTVIYSATVVNTGESLDD